MGLVFVPLTTMTLTAVSQAELPTASGLFNVVRNVGGSVGIAVTTTWLSRQTRVHMSTLIAHVTPWSAATADRLARLQDVYLGAGVDPDTAQRQALRHLYGEIERQASMKAFGDDFLRLAAIFAAVVPLIWLMRRAARRAPASAGRGRGCLSCRRPDRGQPWPRRVRMAHVPSPAAVTPSTACPAAERLRGTSRAEAALSTTTRRTSARGRWPRARAAP